MPSGKWAVVFSRANNFGRGVNLTANMVIIKDIHGNSVHLKASDTVFASSSILEDHAHLETLKTVHLIQERMVVPLDSVEQMWGLLESAPHVYTDR